MTHSLVKREAIPSGLLVTLPMIDFHLNFKRDLKDLKLFILVKNKLQVLLPLDILYVVMILNTLTPLFVLILLLDWKHCSFNLVSLAVLLVSTDMNQMLFWSCYTIILLVVTISMFDSSGVRILLLFGIIVLLVMLPFLIIWIMANVMDGELLHR